ncbi:hypothetical protein V6Z11_D11G110100 [Gossypium hirsutum]
MKLHFYLTCLHSFLLVPLHRLLGKRSWDSGLATPFHHQDGWSKSISSLPLSLPSTADVSLAYK